MIKGEVYIDNLKYSLSFQRISENLWKAIAPADAVETLINIQPKTGSTFEAKIFSGVSLKENHDETVLIDIQFASLKDLAVEFSVKHDESIQALESIYSQQRKLSHIEICATENIEGTTDNGFSNVRLPLCSIPELDWQDIDTSTHYLGRRFSLPFLITGMTGGMEHGKEINLRLASCASKWNIPMGVGSQRIALQNPKLAEIFSIKHRYNNVFLIANIGMSQIIANDCLETADKVIDMIGADAIAIHINVMQELIQPEGDRNFKGVLQSIAKICSHVQVPVIVKEVGCGMDPLTSSRLKEIGVSSIDIAGRGGTSWAYIESLRNKDQNHFERERSKRLGVLFRDWGMTSAESLREVRSRIGEDFPIIASGGFRNGVDALKAKALKADMIAFGLPLFKAALESSEKVSDLLEYYETEFKIAMLACGWRNLDEISEPDERG